MDLQEKPSMNTRTGWRCLVVMALAPQCLLAATIIVPDDNPSLVAAVAGAAAGDTVQVRPGTYTEGSAVEVRQDGLTIEGLGGRPLLAGANRKEGFRVRGAVGVTISGFDIQGRVSAVRLNDCVGCIVQDLVVTDCDAGIRVSGGDANLIVGNTFTNVTHQDAVRVQSSVPFGVGTTVAGNTMTGVHKAGIRLLAAPGSQVVGNTISGSRREGIRLTSCHDSIVGVNDISGGLADGITLSGSSHDATLDANIIGGCRRRGVRVSSSSPALVITNNTVTQNGDHGFDFRSVGAVVDGNVAMGNGGDGFKVGNSLPITITSNDATDNEGYGFDVTNVSQADLLAAGNTASGNLLGDFH
jgi:parallel beta-helix repeat protein